MKYTKEQIIESIQILAKQTGKIPSLGDYRKYKCKPTDPIIIDRFGSWNAALLAAGFTEHSYLDKEELIQVLQDYYTEYGETPTTRIFNADTRYPNSITYKRHFGSWNTALELADIPVKQHKPKVLYSKDYMLTSIRAYVQKHKKIPTTVEFDADKDFPSATTVVKYCGSWGQAIIDAGYTPDIGSGFGYYTKALDGHTYRSKAEAYFVNNYLFGSYTYDIEPAYPAPEQRRKYDWYIKELDVYIELDGGCRPTIVNEKRSINKHLNINCSIIPINNIYLNKSLIELIEGFKIR